jgi:hypothetical protein
MEDVLCYFKTTVRVISGPLSPQQVYPQVVDGGMTSRYGQ